MVEVCHVITQWHCRGFATSQRFGVTTFLRIFGFQQKVKYYPALEKLRTNQFDLFAVAVKKDSIVVGHVPRKIAAICSLFL